MGRRYDRQRNSAVFDAIASRDGKPQANGSGSPAQIASGGSGEITESGAQRVWENEKLRLAILRNLPFYALPTMAVLHKSSFDQAIPLIWRRIELKNFVSALTVAFACPWTRPSAEFKDGSMPIQHALELGAVAMVLQGGCWSYRTTGGKGPEGRRSAQAAVARFKVYRESARAVELPMYDDTKIHLGKPTGDGLSFRAMSRMFPLANEWHQVWHIETPCRITAANLPLFLRKTIPSGPPLLLRMELEYANVELDHVSSVVDIGIEAWDRLWISTTPSGMMSTRMKKPNRPGLVPAGQPVKLVAAPADQNKSPFGVLPIPKSPERRASAPGVQEKVPFGLLIGRTMQRLVIRDYMPLDWLSAQLSRRRALGFPDIRSMSLTLMGWRGLPAFLYEHPYVEELEIKGSRYEMYIEDFLGLDWSLLKTIDKVKLKRLSVSSSGDVRFWKKRTRDTDPVPIDDPVFDLEKFDIAVGINVLPPPPLERLASMIYALAGRKAQINVTQDHVIDGINPPEAYRNDATVTIDPVDLASTLKSFLRDCDVKRGVRLTADLDFINFIYSS